MSSQTARLLETSETLPAVPFDSGPVDDSETAEAADQLLAGLE
jgi:hypothetical protein